MSNSTQRIDRASSHSYRLDGHYVNSVTSIIKAAIAKPALVNWAARTTAEYAADHMEALQGLSRDEIVDLLKGAPSRDRDQAANRGGEVHRIAQRLQRNEEVEVPDALIGHVDSYLKFIKEWKPQDERIERPCYNRKWQYAGTFDNLCSVPGLGHFCMVDFKTNRSGPFGEVALQLAAYGNAEFYQGARGGNFAMPKIDWYGVVWLRADGYSVVPYDVTEREWLMFQHCVHVSHWILNRERVVKRPEIWPNIASEEDKTSPENVVILE